MLVKSGAWLQEVTAEKPSPGREVGRQTQSLKYPGGLDKK